MNMGLFWNSLHCHFVTEQNIYLFIYIGVMVLALHKFRENILIYRIHRRCSPTWQNIDVLI